MQAHPLLTAASALLLSAASFSGAMLMSAEKESPTPAPRVQVEEAPDKALKKWNPKAQKVLAYHDPNALFQLASDGPALRELILATKPFNHLRTEKGQALVSAWWKSVEHYKNWTRRDSEALALFDAWLRHQGTLFQMDSLPRQILWAVDAGDHTVDSKRILGDLAEQERRIRKQHGMKVQQTRITEENDVFRVGMGVPFEAEKQAPSVELQQHALWLRINPKKLIKKLAETEGLPYDVAHYLGTDWEKRAVSLAMNLDKEGDELKIDGVIDGLQPSVFWLGAIIFNEYILRNQDIPVAPLRLQVPKMLPAPDAQALVELRFGCDYQQHDLLKKALVQILNDEAKLGSLATVWNGELLFRLQRGIPFPSPELVLGLQDGGHVQLAAELNAVLVQLGAQEQKPSTGYEKEWTLYAPTGIMQIGLAEDRIVVASSLKMKAMAERVDSQDGFSLVMDLPTLGQSYLPLLWPQIPQKMVPNDNSGLNSQFTLSHHITANIRNAKRTGESIDSAINKAGHDEEARLWFGKDGVNDFNLNEYVSVWKGALNQNGHKYDRTHIIYRTESGWHFFRDPDFWGMSPAREELVSVQKHLKGFKHIGGAALNDIKLHPRGSVPTIDAQSHYPDLATTISLLPRYKLTCNRNDQGQQVFTEQGLPCMGLIIGAAGLGLMEVDPEEEAKDYQKLQDQAAVFALHKDRIDAMKNITLAMKNKKWEKPSDILEHAKKADIAQLGLGDNPSAAEINELGLWAKDFGFDHVLVDTKIDLKARYQHKRFLLQKWSVPLDDDHWVHIGLHHNVGVTFDGPGFDGRSYTDQQKVKKRKKKPKRQKEQAPEDIEF